MNDVHICLISDNNYVMPTKVLIKSLIVNKKNDTKYYIHILSDNIKNDLQQDLKTLSNKNIIIDILNIENPYSNLRNINKYVTNAAFLKFDIPFILNQIDKVIYLDVDIIVQEDLKNLYNIDLQNTYAGVVEDFTIIKFQQRNKELGLKHYFNSGVMLLNLKKIREEHLNKKMLEIYIENGENFYCHDQDVLNLVFKDNITILNPKYNWIVANFDFFKKSFENYYKIEKQDYDISNISIIHYVRLKPWSYRTIPYQKIWQYYYDLLFTIDLKLKTSYLMNAYYFLRGHFMLKMIDKIIKKLKLHS